MSSHRKTKTSALFCLFLLLLSGCAHHPWTTPIEDEQNLKATQLLKSLDQKSRSCEQAIDGDISILYKNLFDKKLISGYFQLYYPSSLKFIVTNPFGQTLLAFAVIERRFQLINTFERRYIKGNTYSYGMLHNIPPILTQGTWDEWLRGTVHLTGGDIIDLRNDTEKRGLWITIRRKKADHTVAGGLTHLLVDPEKTLLLSRILENNRGKIVGEITYGDWKTIGDCHQPQTIGITGLDYSTAIDLKLSNIAIADGLTEEDFHLKAPADYVRQIIP
ncbi:hypothetical protein [Desulfomarina sp.]